MRSCFEGERGNDNEGQSREEGGDDWRGVGFSSIKQTMRRYKRVYKEKGGEVEVDEDKEE